MAIYAFECDDQEREYLRSELADQELFCSPTALTTVSQADEIAADAEIILPFDHSSFTAEMLDHLPNLKLIATRTTGYDHIDIAAAHAKGIVVCNVPAYGENTVAEYAFGLLLTLSRKLVQAIEETRAGKFSDVGLQGFDLKGRTIGVIGTGRIGQHTLRMAKGFEMNLLGFDLYPNQKAVDDLGLKYCSLEELLAESDVISLHAPGTPENHHLLNRERLALCKKGVVVINTARGDLIDADALLEALESGQVAAAGLDVLENERALGRGEIPETIQRLLAMPNVVITPHSAFDTREAIFRILTTSVANVRAFQGGEAQNAIKG